MKCQVCEKEIRQSHNLVIEKEEKKVCAKHYAQYKKFGKFLDSSPKPVKNLNDFRIEDEIVYIYTVRSNGDCSGFCIIDKEDLDRVITRKWRLWHGRFFTGVKKPISLHDFILKGQRKEGQVIDHINGNPADNRKKNLRITTQNKNVINQSLKSSNTSGFAGIYFDKSRNKWAVEIKLNYIKCFLGRYSLLEDACYIRYNAELLLFKEFRNKNNDKNLISLAEKCTQKEKLLAYLEQRISEKFLI